MSRARCASEEFDQKFGRGNKDALALRKFKHLSSYRPPTQYHWELTIIRGVETAGTFDDVRVVLPLRCCFSFSVISHSYSPTSRVHRVKLFVIEVCLQDVALRAAPNGSGFDHTLAPLLEWIKMSNNCGGAVG